MAFGRVWEAPISMFVKEHTGVMPNEWLISSAVSDHYLATPDGLSLNHEVISEIKNYGEGLGSVEAPHPVPQAGPMAVTCYGCEDVCVCVDVTWERAGLFVPEWFEPRIHEIERDEEMIASLVKVADDLWEEVWDD